MDLSESEVSGEVFDLQESTPPETEVAHVSPVTTSPSLVPYDSLLCTCSQFSVKSPNPRTHGV